jgi:hypothetical protein
VPYIHRPEVGAIGVRIADAVDNGDFPLIPQAFDGPHARIKAKGIIDGQDILGRNGDRRAEIVVEPVGVWDNGVEAVVAAAQLYDHKRFVSYGGRHSIRPLGVRDGRFSP